MFELELDDAIAIFEQCNDGIVLLDARGHQQFANEAFLRWPLQLQQLLIAGSPPQGYQLKTVPLIDGQALIARADEALIQHSGTMLATLLAEIRAGDDIFSAAAAAIHRATGWRWISITRFVDSNVEVLAHWDTNSISDNFAFEIAGTPCEQMLATERYTLFSDVATAFPDNTALQAIGAHTYAGQIYRDANQQPMGHIMAIHDQREVDYRHVEDVITLGSLALSAHMQLAQTNSELITARNASLTDPLTGLANRKRFDEYRDTLARNYQQAKEDACLAIIDLDSFKGYNDTCGHRAGDQLLQLVSNELRQLGRSSDIAFRIGGDEFALIFPGLNSLQLPHLCQQFKAAMQRVSLVCGYNIESSVGCALLSEACGCTEQWYELADQRMYHQKKAAA